jgi:phospholipid/cholesterol/gamma-HCH transport system substrate-binding protein
VSEQGRKEIMIGAFVMVGLVLVGVMFWVLENQAFQKKYTVSAEFKYAGGIREGTPVHMAGKPIGQVKDVQFRENADKGEVLVGVVLEIEEKYTIHRDTKLTVGSVGLLGEKIIEFTLGTVASGNLKKDGTERLVGVVPPGLEDLQATLETAVGDLRGTIVKVNTFLDHLNDAEFQGALKGAITGVDDLAKKAGSTIDKVDGFMTKADSFVGKADEFAGKANTAMDGVNKIVTNADEVVAKLNELGAKLSTLSDEVGKTVAQTGESVNKLAVSLQQNSEQLKSILESLNGIVTDAQGGKGTLGHLLKDDTTARKIDELLASLKVTSDSLAQTSDFLRAHPNSVIFGRDKEGQGTPVDWRDRK